MENPFKNIAINLHATGPSAVLVAWILAVAALGLYGNGDLANRAMTLLAFAGGSILVALAARSS